MKKPDRFERLLDGEKFVMKKEVINLLRKEHAWMRRMVREHQKLSNIHEYKCACENILIALNQRRK